MKYQDKIEIIKSLGNEYFLKRNIYSLDVSSIASNIGYIEDIIKSYPWAPKSYIEFLKVFNGGEFDDVRLLGDESCKYGSVLETVRMFSPTFEDKIPIAKDSGGDIFWLNKNGEVYWVMIDNIDDQNSARFIAEDFEQFMNTFCLGAKYREHYGDNEWTEFLKSQQWG